MISFACDCGRPYRVGDGKAGSRMMCSACGRMIVVPSGSEELPVGEWLTDDGVCDSTTMPGALGIGAGHRSETERACPACGAALRFKGYWYCPACGWDVVDLGSPVRKLMRRVSCCGVPLLALAAVVAVVAVLIKGC